MNFFVSPSGLVKRLTSAKLTYQLVEVVLLICLAVAAALCVWVLVAPKGPVGKWKAITATAPVDDTILVRFDPFFRDGSATDSAQAAVTNLPIKLFGIRVNQAIGRGSAIIETPDGLQSSFATGDEIMPGVTLKSVTFEGAIISRGGVDEQIFLDQSVAAEMVDLTAPSRDQQAPAAAPPSSMTAKPPAPAPPPAPSPVGSVPSTPAPISDENAVLLPPSAAGRSLYVVASLSLGRGAQPRRHPAVGRLALNSGQYRMAFILRLSEENA
jgi:general secretion pathway protein C